MECLVAETIAKTRRAYFSLQKPIKEIGRGQHTCIYLGRLCQGPILGSGCIDRS
jgi:hypothetical protein